VTAPIPDSFSRLALQRHSIRAYQARPVADSLLRQVLTLARTAPSGANLQPGSFLSVVGEARQRLTADLAHGWRSGAQEPEDYSYFPTPMPMTLRRRQVAAAKALYGSLGIAQDDRAGRDQQFEQNFRFFGAPVALIATINGDFGSGGYMDFGMTLRSDAGRSVTRLGDVCDWSHGVLSGPDSPEPGSGRQLKKRLWHCPWLCRCRCSGESNHH
jgi:hypothetical protein